MIEALQTELASWRGTPFRPHQARKGVGADCVRFALAVLENLGCLRPVQWPHYPIRGGGVELLLEHLRQVAGLMEVAEPARAGDLCVVAGPHILICERAGRCWHAAIGVGVGPVDVPAGRILHVFRASLFQS